ncbi:MAG: hypothetical protein RLN86_08690 [Cyclobacteriaceae bacterium]
MNKRAWILSILIGASLSSFGQSRLRKLPTIINHPAINVSAPYISLDGNSLIYVSDNADENALTMFHTVKKDAVNWKEPVMLPRTVNSRLNFLKGSALSSNGQQLYISSLKGGGLGGFDILVSELRGKVWSEPINIGLPINSSGHEACPSLTADGNMIYFMRCEKMDQNSADGCKLFFSKKSRTGKWEEPVELPSFINTGNSQTPRIMGDGETLLFASNKLPQNKGKMDLYVTRYINATWSEPVPLTFCNTAGDDQYVSASSQGRYLLKDQPGQRKTEIVELLFPPELKPKASMKIEGLVTGISDPSSVYVAVFNQADQSRVYNGRPEKDGSFSLYVSEGNIYDLSVEPAQDTFTFYSRVFDLTGDRIPFVETIEAPIEPISQSTEIDLSGIAFEPFSPKLSKFSAQELRRLVRLIKGNTDHRFQIEVTLNDYQSDSVRSSADLSELTIDTLHFEVERQVLDTVRMDSLLAAVNKADSLSNSADSTNANATSIIEIPSLRQDSLEAFYKTVLVDSISIKKTYHNDRTEAQADSIVKHLIDEGVPNQVLTVKCRRKEGGLAEERKISVTLKVLE